MRSSKSKPFTKAAAAHLAAVKMTPCAVCSAPPPVDAHHIRQGDHYTTVGLCRECHTGTQGIHGDKTLWRVRKMPDEVAALNVTLRYLAMRA